jgi:vacuolar-type H+-ATPase subunit H
MTNDPVQTIKDEEALGKKQIADFTQDNKKKRDDHKIKKEEELKQYKEELQKKGQDSLEQAKQDAKKKFKEISEDEERNRNSVVSQAESKKSEAVKCVVSFFEKHLVK